MAVVTAQHVEDALADARLDPSRVNASQLARWAGAGKEAKLVRHLQSRYRELAENRNFAQRIARQQIEAQGPARGSMHPGPTPRPKERAVHLGEPPTHEIIANKSAMAEDDPRVQIHGMSVFVADPAKRPGWQGEPMGIADVRELRTAFPMHKTMGAGHYTVELPKPVTREVAQRFLRFFNWLMGGQQG